jgi:putative ABC transport system permease protein
VYVFCSHDTLRTLVPLPVPELATCMVAHCRDPRDVDTVVRRLHHDYPDMAVFSSSELSRDVRQYWLFRSRGGIVMICTMVLAVLVGLVITSQTLYAAVVAQLREFAVLEALGIPRRRMVQFVLTQSLWLGLGGVSLALPITVILGQAALLLQTQVVLSATILWLTTGLTLGMAMIAGASALRPLRNIQPANLLR